MDLMNEAMATYGKAMGAMRLSPAASSLGKKCGQTGQGIIIDYTQRLHCGLSEGIVRILLGPSSLIDHAGSSSEASVHHLT